MQIHTHYDNLKVLRTAPNEVIRAAYKTLTQKHHPDRNPGNPDAARIMSLLNASYLVLSDPEKRRAYDESLRRRDREAQSGETKAAGSRTGPSPAPSSAGSGAPAPPNAQTAADPTQSSPYPYLFGAAFIIFIIIFLMMVNYRAQPTSGPVAQP